MHGAQGAGSCLPQVTWPNQGPRGCTQPLTPCCHSYSCCQWWRGAHIWACHVIHEVMSGDSTNWSWLWNQSYFGSVGTKPSSSLCARLKKNNLWHWGEFKRTQKLIKKKKKSGKITCYSMLPADHPLIATQCGTASVNQEAITSGSGAIFDCSWSKSFSSSIIQSH